MTPIVRNADQKSLSAISLEVCSEIVVISFLDSYVIPAINVNCDLGLPSDLRLLL